MSEEFEKGDFLGLEEFYDLMQAYRTAPYWDQKEVTLAFEAVKKFISAEILRLHEELRK